MDWFSTFADTNSTDTGTQETTSPKTSSFFDTPERDAQDAPVQTPTEKSFFDTPPIDPAQPLDPQQPQEQVYNILGKPMKRAELESYESGKKFLEIDDLQKQGTRGFGEAVTDVKLTDVPYFGDVLGVSGILKVGRDFKTLQDGGDISDEDRIKVHAYLKEQERLEQQGVGGMVGDVLRQMPWFAAEIATYSLIGGVATAEIGGAGAVVGAGAGALQAGARVASKTIARAVTNRMFKNASKDWLEKIAGKEFAQEWADINARRKIAAKAIAAPEAGKAMRAAGVTVGEAADNMLVRGTTVALLDTAANAAANIMQGENPLETNRSAMERIDSLIRTGDENENVSRMIGLGDRYFEYLSEMSGPVLGTAFAPVGAKIAKMTGRAEGESLLAQIKRTYYGPSGELAKTADSAARAELADRAFKASALGTVLKTISESKLVPLDDAFRILRMSGYHGWAEEIGEERVGDFMRGLFGVQGEHEKDWGLANALQQAIPDPQQLMTEAIAFAIPGLAVSAIHSGQLHMRGNVSQLEYHIDRLTRGSTPQQDAADGRPVVEVMQGKILESNRTTTKPTADEVAESLKFISDFNRKPESGLGQFMSGFLSVASKIATGNVLGIHEGDRPVEDLLSLNGVSASSAAFTELRKQGYKLQGTTLEDVKKMEESPAKQALVDKAEKWTRTAFAPELSKLRDTLVVSDGVLDIARKAAAKAKGVSVDSLTEADIVAQMDKLSLDGTLLKYDTVSEGGRSTALTGASGGRGTVYSLSAMAPTGQAIEDAAVRTLISAGVHVGVRVDGGKTVRLTGTDTGLVDALTSAAMVSLSVEDLDNLVADPVSPQGAMLSRRTTRANQPVDFGQVRNTAAHIKNQVVEAQFKQRTITAPDGRRLTYTQYNDPKRAGYVVIAPGSVGAQQFLEARKMSGPIDANEANNFFAKHGVEDKAATRVRLVSPLGFESKDPEELWSHFSSGYGNVDPRLDTPEARRQAFHNLVMANGARLDPKTGYYSLTPGGLNEGAEVVIALTPEWHRTLTEERTEVAARKERAEQGKPSTPAELRFKAELASVVGKRLEDPEISQKARERLGELLSRSASELYSHAVSLFGYGFDMAAVKNPQLADTSPIYGEMQFLRDEILAMPTLTGILHQAARAEFAYDFVKEAVQTGALKSRFASNLDEKQAAEVAARWERPIEPSKPAEASKPKPEAPKPEAPKPEAPKPEAPKPEAPKPEEPGIPKTKDGVIAALLAMPKDTLDTLFGETRSSLKKMKLADLRALLVRARAELASKAPKSAPEASLLDSNAAVVSLVDHTLYLKENNFSGGPDWKVKWKESMVQGDPEIIGRLADEVASRQIYGVPKEAITEALERIAKRVKVEPADPEAERPDEQVTISLGDMFPALSAVDTAAADNADRGIRNAAADSDFKDQARIAKATEVIHLLADTEVGDPMIVQYAAMRLAKELTGADLVSEETLQAWSRKKVDGEDEATRFVREAIFFAGLENANMMHYNLAPMQVALPVTLQRETRGTRIRPAYPVSTKSWSSAKYDGLRETLASKSQSDLDDMFDEAAQMPPLPAAKSEEDADPAVRRKYVEYLNVWIGNHFGNELDYVITDALASTQPIRDVEAGATPWGKFRWLYQSIVVDFGSERKPDFQGRMRTFNQTSGINKLKLRPDSIDRDKAAVALASKYLFGSARKTGEGVVIDERGVLSAVQQVQYALNGTYPSNTHNPVEGKTPNVVSGSPIHAAIDSLNREDPDFAGANALRVAVFTGVVDSTGGMSEDGKDMEAAKVIANLKAEFNSGLPMMFPVLSGGKDKVTLVVAPGYGKESYETYEAAFEALSRKLWPAMRGSNIFTWDLSKINKRAWMMSTGGTPMRSGIEGGVPDVFHFLMIQGAGSDGGTVVTDPEFAKQVRVSAAASGMAIYKGHYDAVNDKGELTILKSAVNLVPNTAPGSIEEAWQKAAASVTSHKIVAVATHDSFKNAPRGGTKVSVKLGDREYDGYVVEMRPGNFRETTPVDDTSRAADNTLPVQVIGDMSPDSEGTGTYGIKFDEFATPKLETIDAAITEAVKVVDDEEADAKNVAYARAGVKKGHPSLLQGYLYRLSSTIRDAFTMQAWGTKSVMLPTGGYVVVKKTMKGVKDRFTRKVESREVTELVTEWMGGIVDPYVRPYTETVVDGKLISKPAAARANVVSRGFRFSRIQVTGDFEKALEAIRTIAMADHNASTKSETVGKSELAFWKSEKIKAWKALRAEATDFIGNTIPKSWSYADMVRLPAAPSREAKDYVIDERMLEREENIIRGGFSMDSRTPGGSWGAHKIVTIDAPVTWTTFTNKAGDTYTVVGEENLSKYHPMTVYEMGADFDADKTSQHVFFVDSNGLIPMDPNVVPADREGKPLEGRALERYRTRVIGNKVLAAARQAFYSLPLSITGISINKEKWDATTQVSVKDADGKVKRVTLATLLGTKVPGDMVATVEGWKAATEAASMSTEARDVTVAQLRNAYFALLSDYSKVAYGTDGQSFLTIPASEGVKERIIRVSRNGRNKESDYYGRDAVQNVINIVIDAISDERIKYLGIRKNNVDMFVTALFGQDFKNARDVETFMQDWTDWASSEAGAAYLATRDSMLTAFDHNKAANAINAAVPGAQGTKLMNVKRASDAIADLGRIMNFSSNPAKTYGDIAFFYQGLHAMKSTAFEGVSGILETYYASPAGKFIEKLSEGLKKHYNVEGDPALGSGFREVLKAIRGKDTKRKLFQGTFNKAHDLYAQAALVEAAWRRLPAGIQTALTHRNIGMSPMDTVLGNIATIFKNGWVRHSLGEGENSVMRSMLPISADKSAQIRSNLVSKITPAAYDELLADSAEFDTIVAEEDSSRKDGFGIMPEDVQPLLALYSYARYGFKSQLGSESSLALVRPDVVASLGNEAVALANGTAWNGAKDVLDFGDKGVNTVKKSFESASIISKAAEVPEIADMPSLAAATGSDAKKLEKARGPHVIVTTTASKMVASVPAGTAELPYIANARSLKEGAKVLLPASMEGVTDVYVPFGTRGAVAKVTGKVMDIDVDTLRGSTVAGAPEFSLVEADSADQMLSQLAYTGTRNSVNARPGLLAALRDEYARVREMSPEEQRNALLALPAWNARGVRLADVPPERDDLVPALDKFRTQDLIAPEDEAMRQERQQQGAAELQRDEEQRAGEAPEFSLVTHTEALATTLAEQKLDSMDPAVRNALKVPDVARKIMSDWKPLLKRLETATGLEDSLAAINWGRKNSPGFGTAQAASLRYAAVAKYPDADLAMVGHAELSNDLRLSPLGKAAQALREEQPEPKQGFSASLLHWREGLDAITNPVTDYGTPALARVLMTESGYNTALLEQDDIRYGMWAKMLGVWGTDRRIYRIIRKTVPYGKEKPGETVDLVKFENTITEGPGFTEDQYTMQTLMLELLHDALSYLPGGWTTKPSKDDAVKAIEKARVMSPGIAVMADGSDVKLLEAVLPRKIVAALLAERARVRADVDANRGKYYRKYANMLEEKNYPTEYSTDLMNALYALAYAEAGIADFHEITAPSGKRHMTAPVWTVPGKMIHDMYMSETDGPRQVLLDAKRMAAEIDPAKLLVDVREAYDKDFEYRQQKTPDIMQRGDLPFLRYKKSYGPQRHGAGFLGPNENVFHEELLRLTKAVTEPQAEKYKAMAGIAHDKKTGTVRPLSEVSPAMLRLLLRMRGVPENQIKDNPYEDIVGGLFAQNGVEPGMNYADVVNDIHDAMVTRLAQRMVDREIARDAKMKNGRDEELEPLAFLKATMELRNSKNFRHRELARSTQRSFYTNSREAYRNAGLLPANGNILEKLHKYSSEMATTSMHATMLNQFLLMPNTDFTPIVIAVPALDFKGPGVVRETIWQEHAKMLARVTGTKLDASKSAKENIDAIVKSHIAVPGNKNYVEIPSSYDSISRFHVFVRQSGEEPVVDILANGFKGGEAVSMMKKILNDPWADPWDALKWVEAVNSRMKIAAMQGSFFFPVSALESIIAASGGKAFGQIVGISPNVPSLVDIYERWTGGHPEYAEIIQLLSEEGSKLSRGGNPIDIPINVLDKDIKRVEDWLRSVIGRDAAHNARWITQLPKMQARFIFEKIFNTTKIWMAMDRIEFERARARKLGLPEPTKKEVIKKWVNTIDMAMGGDNPWRTSYFTPTVMRMLSLLMFSPSWTKAAWDIGGGGVLSQPFLKNYLKPYEARFIFLRNWPAMAFYVLFLIPAFVQASAYALAQLGPDPDDKDKIKQAADDTPWIWKNEEERKLYADLTPVLRKMPWYKGAPTGARRFYVHWGKQSYEVVDGWLDNPWKTFTGKLSQVARLAVEQATGESAGSSFDLGFKGQGLAGILFDKEGGFEGSRVGSITQKFLPFSVLAWAQNPDAAPLQMLAPISKGMSFGKASTAYYELLMTWANKDTYSKFYTSATAQKNLEALGAEILDAAERNGYDPEKILESARAAALKDIWGRLYKAIDTQDVGKIEEYSRSAMRLNGTLASALASAKARNKLYGKGTALTPEQREALISAFRNP